LSTAALNYTVRRRWEYQEEDGVALTVIWRSLFHLPHWRCVIVITWRRHCAAARDAIGHTLFPAFPFNCRNLMKKCSELERFKSLF